MKEIVNRLQENRNIERAKSILESNGYKVTKRLKEADEPSVLGFDSKFRVFTKEDFYGYAGAEKLPDGSGPFISNGLDDAEIIVAGDEDGPRVDVYEIDKDMIGYYVNFKSVEDAKRDAMSMYSEFMKGAVASEVAKSHRMNRF